MQQLLIDHSPDLKQLQDSGYKLEISGGQFLLVHHIPYLNSWCEIKDGTLVCVLTLSTPTKTGPPHNHTAYFIGDTPCDSDGNALIGIINNSTIQKLSDNIVVNHYFSAKPPSGNYVDNYEKVRTYYMILSSQVDELKRKRKTNTNSNEQF
jgi:hypothetical protein